MAELVAGAFLTATFDNLFKRLASLEFRKNSTGYKLKQLEPKLKTAKLYLDDAENRQLSDKSIKEWLDDLKHVVFQVDDLSEEIRDNKNRNFGRKFLVEFLKSFFQCVAGTVRGELDEISMELDSLSGRVSALRLNHCDGTARDGGSSSTTNTAPLREEHHVFGRKDDQDKILKLLLSNEAFGNQKIGVVPIVGMGGIGKTTLAQLVYHDLTRLMEAEFNPKAWVTVSTTEFDVVEILKSILEQISPGGVGTGIGELSQLQHKMKDALTGKKFLIVLDDVWDENYRNWDVLKSIFEWGALGSRVVVTTRSKNVGEKVKTGPIHELREMPGDECWRIFIDHAFSGDSNDYQRLHETGRKIVAKCKGLPLAVKAMGGLLRSERDFEEWENVLNNHVWDCDEKEGVLPSLWLSYRYLSSPLKQCFAYCSAFPKDYEFDKKEMVLWWMAEGFLPSDKNERRSMEETGEKYFDDLVSRLLFQRSSRRESRFVVHYLVHDLATFVSGEFAAKEGIELNRFTIRTRHVSHYFRSSDSTKLLCGVSKAKHLRAFHSIGEVSAGYDDEFVKVLTRETSCLRVLSLFMVPTSVSFHNLKHLRYLGLFDCQFEELPSSVCSLINLQTLLVSLFQSRPVVQLPNDFSKLIKLRHLEISGSELANMPPHMGNLKELRTLKNFIVGDPGVSACSNINEMQELQHLSGELRISGLQNAHKFEGVGKDILKHKANLKKLVLEWDETEVNERKDEDVLDALQPYTNLEQLVIQGYQSVSSFPIWVGDMSFKKLTSVELRMISCKSLPPLGQLPSLLKLVIKGSEKLEKISLEFYGNNSSATSFQCLETLEIEMKSLKEWVYVDKAFPCLKNLTFNGCLESFSLDKFPMLRKLSVRDCCNLKSITNDGNSESLTSLKLEDCPEMESFPEAGLPKSLTRLEISNCSKLMSPQTRLDLQNLPSLESLRISLCECESASMSLELFAQVLLPNSLASLHLRNLGGFKSINGRAFEQAKSLGLYIFYCNELESLPEKELLSCLSYLDITGCSLLEEKYLESKRESYQHSSKVEGGTTSLVEEEEKYEVRIANLLLKSIGPGVPSYQHSSKVFIKKHDSQVEGGTTSIMALEMAAAATGASLTVTIQDLLTRLSSRFGNDSTFMDLRSKLEKAKLLLNDAEDRQLKEPKVKQWLDDLKDVTFRIDDLSDEIGDDDDHNKQHSEKGYLESMLDAAADSVKSVSQYKISEILNELARLLDLAMDLAIELCLAYRPNMIKVSLRRDTPWLEEHEVFGREDDKKRILELLLTDDGAFGGHNIGVVPIVGMAGIGKTTLAQLVYNDNEVDKGFQLKAWVTVSTDFNVDRIMKTIFHQITPGGVGTHIEELSQLYRELRSALRGKKFLLVLDDVWDGNYHNWDLLMSDFKLGASGSRILVTTRSRSVGSVVKTGPDHVLTRVLSDKCWSIFIQHAFSGGDLNAYPELHEVGRKIVEKCKGLPSELNAMGSLLRLERDFREWENIMNNHVWDCNEIGVLPSLWLSYHYLPSRLKQCFAYCSVFPQDFEFDKKKMVLWWMAEGYLPSDEKERRSMEETGEKYFDDLVSRSLFQRSSRNKSRFVVHYLVHDLAAFVSGEFAAKEGIELNRFTIWTRHVSHYFRSSDSTKLLCGVSKAKHLRAFHSIGEVSAGYDDEFVKVLTRGTRCLRVLSLFMVPTSVSFHNLKHLRYLGLFDCQFEELPSSICSLINLQTLLVSLFQSRPVVRLPNDFSKLIKLRHLEISGSELANMPPHMGNLKELRTLRNFIVGDPGVSACSNINEMQELQHLSGELRISGLQNAHKFEGVGKDILRHKANLKKLVLEWDETEVNEREDKDVLDTLQPHTNLEQLVIQGYQSVSSFPIWVGDMSFKKLTSMELRMISCKSLPLLGQLPSLLKLVIKGSEKLEKIGLEFYGNNSSVTSFQCLETLEIEMKSLKEWVYVDKAFPRLKKLRLNGCKVLPTNCKTIEELEVVENSCLECFPLDQFPKLRKLLLRRCTNLKSVTNDANSESLTEISLIYCPEMESFPEAGLPTSLTHLVISRCSKLISPPTRLGLQNLPALVSLSIWYCECDSASSSELFAQVVLPNSLAFLELHNLGGYKTLNGSAFQQAKSLKRLEVYDCNELESLPEKELLSCLTYLEIRDCLLLKEKYLESKRANYQHRSKVFINRHDSQVEIYQTTSLMGEEYEVRIANLLLKSMSPIMLPHWMREER